MDNSQTKTFSVSGAQVEYFEDFTRVSSGAYTANQYLTDSSAVSVDGLVTMDVANHGLSVSDTLVIQDDKHHSICTSEEK